MDKIQAILAGRDPNKKEAPGLFPKSVSPSAPRIFTAPKENNGVNYQVILNKPLVTAEDFVELIHILTHAKPVDDVNIYIGSPGGNLFACECVIGSMLKSEATVITHAHGQAASAAAMIWAYGDVVKVGRWADIMFHSSSSFISGMSLDIRDEINGALAILNNHLQLPIQRGLLTEEEFIKLAEKKQDVFIPAHEAALRADKFNEQSNMVGMQNTPGEESE